MDDKPDLLDAIEVTAQKQFELLKKIGLNETDALTLFNLSMELCGPIDAALYKAFGYGRVPQMLSALLAIMLLDAEEFSKFIENH